MIQSAMSHCTNHFQFYFTFFPHFILISRITFVFQFFLFSFHFLMYHICVCVCLCDDGIHSVTKYSVTSSLAIVPKSQHNLRGAFRVCCQDLFCPTSVLSEVQTSALGTEPGLDGRLVPLCSAVAHPVHKNLGLLDLSTNASDPSLFFWLHGNGRGILMPPHNT